MSFFLLQGVCQARTTGSVSEKHCFSRKSHSQKEEVGKCKLQSTVKYPREIFLVSPSISTPAAEQHPQICNVGHTPNQAGLTQNQATGQEHVLLAKNLSTNFQ